MKPSVLVIVGAAGVFTTLLVVRYTRSLSFYFGLGAVAAVATTLVRVVDAGELGWFGYFAFTGMSMLAAATAGKILHSKSIALRLVAGLIAAIIVIPLGVFVSYFFAAEGI